MSEVFARILYDIVFGLSSISYLETASRHLHDPFISGKRKTYAIKPEVTELPKEIFSTPKDIKYSSAGIRGWL
jgi:hypothetical protein